MGSGAHHAVLVAYTSAGDLNSDSSFTVSGSGGKQTVSRKLLPSNGTHFWQPRFYDFNVFSEQKQTLIQG